MAAKGITVSGGVIDAGYSGELVVLLTNHSDKAYVVKPSDKIVQMIPIQVFTSESKWVDELPESNREDKGFGSSGR